MRILSLHFKNLNSLAGEWTIDFTNPEYISSGIFAITGPTGAGKSTILDAITLALYGRTPRLGKISKNASEIMSRQTGEYFSEVEFVSEKGRYRCRWSQKRAHKKPDTDLQPPRHEIVDAETGIPLETKQAAVQEKVIAVTGLDYQQFTRSILLAQGDFATFLDAKADERAPILEKITGTGIYGEISIAVHERFGKEKAALDTLFAKADTIETISPEQAAALKKELEQHQQDIRETARRCKEREAAVTWLDTLAALETEIARLEERAQALAKRRAAAEKDLGALSLARRARDLEGMYSSLFALRGQQEHETQEKTACEGRLLGLSAAYASTLEELRLAQDRRDTTAGEKQREDELCRRVRDLDARIREVKTRRDERTREKQRLSGETGTLRDAIRSAEAQAEVIRQERVQVTEYLNGHPRDEKLISSLSGIASAVRQIHATEESAETKQDALRGVEQTLADAEQVVLRRKSELDRAAGRVQDVLAASARIQTDLVKITGGRDSAALRVLAEEDTERGHRLRALVDILARIDEDEDVLTKLAADLDAARGRRTVEEKRHTGLIKDAEKAAEILRLSEENRIYLARIKKFEEDRQALTDGKPCPLCGSTEHPWCTGAVPEPGDAEKKHATYKKENEDFQAQLRKSEADLAGIDGGIQAGEAALRDREAQAKKARAELDAGCRALGIPAGPDTKPALAAALKECTARIEEIKSVLTQAEEKEQELRKAEQNLVKEKDAHRAIQRDYDKALGYRDTKNGERERLTAEIAAVGEDARRQKAALLASVQEYDILVFSVPKMTEEILAALTKRRDEYATHHDRLQDLNDRLRQCEGVLDKNRSLFSAAEKSLADLSGILAGIETEYLKLSAQRKELYGEKDPVAEEARIAGLAKEASEAFSAANEKTILADKQKTACEEQIHTLTGKIASRVPVLAGQEQAFLAAQKKAGFSREEEFLSARLSPDRLAELEAFETGLVREETETAAGLRERTTKRAAEQERALTKENREDLAQAVENDKTRITGLQIDTGRLKTNLEQYDGQVRQQLMLADEITKQKKEFAKWEKLHDLIGSHDGRKFTVFVQGLTFERLVVQANRHLRTMSNRYLLVRNKNSPLDLDIIDNYQAGEIRTTKNLSGGERFLVSLALALGLSGMASHNVRIDSLFLDEGFGTLDEDTLETALETLSSLQREGKIIGIISHVPSLKERIPVQIQVEISGGGRSRFTGPGCIGPL